jgi:hypothetical protein
MADVPDPSSSLTLGSGKKFDVAVPECAHRR